MKRLLSRFFPHAVIVLSLMTLTFFVFDFFNAVMGFMTGELSKWVFALLAVTALATALMLISRQWAEDDRRARKAARQQAALEAALAEADTARKKRGELGEGSAYALPPAEPNSNDIA